MNWYVAKIIYKTTTGQGSHNAQYDEQLRLISAVDDRQAFTKAYELGLNGQRDFLNNAQQLVRWELVDVAEINLLSALTDGAELYYQIQEHADAGIYEAWAHHKSQLLGMAAI